MHAFAKKLSEPSVTFCTPNASDCNCSQNAARRCVHGLSLRRDPVRLQAMLMVRDLNKSFAGPRPRTVFAGVDLDLAPGEYVAVMGESGIGKSTLLNLVAGLDNADGGSIKLDGVELTTLED